MLVAPSLEYANERYSNGASHCYADFDSEALFLLLINKHAIGYLQSPKLHNDNATMDDDNYRSISKSQTLLKIVNT